jgi:hypothetical protein
MTPPPPAVLASLQILDARPASNAQISAKAAEEGDFLSDPRGIGFLLSNRSLRGRNLLEQRQIFFSRVRVYNGDLLHLQKGG